MSEEKYIPTEQLLPGTPRWCRVAIVVGWVDRPGAAMKPEGTLAVDSCEAQLMIDAAAVNSLMQALHRTVGRYAWMAGLLACEDPFAYVSGQRGESPPAPAQE